MVAEICFSSFTNLR